MAHRPHFPGWPGQRPAPAPAPYGEPFRGEFRPGVPMPQRSPRPSFYEFPPRGFGAPSGAPFGPPSGPPGYVPFRNVYPSPGAGSPGFNNNFQGWSPFPGGYPAAVASPRATSPSVISSQSQGSGPGLGYGAHGNTVPGQAQGQHLVQAQQGLPAATFENNGGAVVGYNGSGGVPWSNGLHSNNLAVKPLFLNWIDESIKDTASSQVLGDSGGLSLRASSDKLRSSELYRLVELVEEAVSKILALTDLQSLSSRTEWGVCPFNSHHVVPAEALLRHTLQCPSSSGGTVEASSLLECLQYPHTVDLDRTEPFTHGDRHPGAESSSNNATLALNSVVYTSIRRLDLATVKQEPEHVDTEGLSEIPRLKTKVGTNNLIDEKPDLTTLPVHTTRQQLDPSGSLFFYGDAPGVVLTSLAHYSSKSFGDAMFSMPHCLRIELERCSHLTFEGISNEGAKLQRIDWPSRTVENARAESRLTEEDEQESHGVVEGSVSTRRIGTTADGSITRIQHVGEREEAACIGLLPSMLRNLRKELETWKDMPSQFSLTVLQAATRLGTVRRASIVEWLLLHSPAYGVVLDVAMGPHISCLVQLYFKALRTHSLLLFEQRFGRSSSNRDTSIPVDTVVLESPTFAEASAWLASWLSHLYGLINSKAIVLDILKHCLNLCGRFLSVVPLDLHPHRGGFNTGGKTEDVTGASDEQSNISTEHSKMLSRRTDNLLEDILGVKQVGAAMDAVYERANFERYIKSWMSVNKATKPQRIASYDMTVISANNERAKRRNFHAVCEHDGLTWQSFHQEEKRDKSKAELLAEERDYKRRRMSYRGKKLKRTPLQVLHDIIENHMAEITEAGGIGCFSKQPPRKDLEVQQEAQVGSPSQPNIQHHSGSAHHLKMSNIEMAGNVPRLYDGHRKTSSSERNESRPSSKRRYGYELHHSSRR